jgi:hypothetical protein
VSPSLGIRVAISKNIHRFCWSIAVSYDLGIVMVRILRRSSTIAMMILRPIHDVLVNVAKLEHAAAHVVARRHECATVFEASSLAELGSAQGFGGLIPSTSTNPRAEWEGRAIESDAPI